MTQHIDLGIDPKSFDPARAITLSAASLLVRGRGGMAACVSVLRRWANPKKGCRPRGADGPVLLFPAVKLGGHYYSLPEWVAKFEAERARLGSGWPEVLPMPRHRSKRSFDAAQRRAAERYNSR